MEKGVLGKPKFSYGDKVKFDMLINGDKPTTLHGEVYVVDKYGTFEQNEEPSYDVFVDYFGDGGCLFKHIRESACEQVTGE